MTTDRKRKIKNLPLHRCKSMIGSLRHQLETRLKTKQTGTDPKLSAFTYAEIPDWLLRQWLDYLREMAVALDKDPPNGH